LTPNLPLLRLFLVLLFVVLSLLSQACTDTPASYPEAVASRLVELLTDPSPDTRRTAALSLGKIASPLTGPALVQSLNDPDPLVRQYGAWALGNMEGALDDRVIGALLERLDDASPAVVVAAAEAIGRIGATRLSVEPLIQALQQRGVTVRSAAVTALGWLEAPSSYQALIRALDDPDPRVRQGSVSALGELGDRRAISPIRNRLLHDPDAGVRSESAFRLGKLDGPSTRTSLGAVARNDPSPQVRWWAQWAIAQGVTGGLE
jgi:HEAT repeat protein